MLGERLKVMLGELGLSYDSAAKILHVTPRTVRYWAAGQTAIPYAAYRLLRIMTGAELPIPGWDGWHMHSGKLWSPEGFGFLPGDSSWWGHLVRKARLFQTMYDRETQLRMVLMRAGRVDAQPRGAPAPAGGTGAEASARAPAPAAAGAAQPPRANLFIGHFTTKRGNNAISK